jgi:hypothetical protein
VIDRMIDEDLGDPGDEDHGDWQARLQQKEELPW